MVVLVHCMVHCCCGSGRKVSVECGVLVVGMVVVKEIFIWSVSHGNGHCRSGCCEVVVVKWFL